MKETSEGPRENHRQLFGLFKRRARKKVVPPGSSTRRTAIPGQEVTGGGPGRENNPAPPGKQTSWQRAALEESNRRYTDIFQNVNNVLAVVDERRRISELSHGLDTGVRRRCEEILGRSLDEFRDEPMEKLVSTLVSSAAESGKMQGADIRLILKDGIMIDFELSTARLLGDDNIMGIKSTSRRLKEMEVLEKNLTEAVTYLDSIIQDSPDPFLTTDLEGNIFEFNRAAEELSGYRADEIRDMDISHLIRGFDVETFRETVLGEPLHDLETELLARNGNIVHVKLSASKLVDADGVPIGMFFIAQDITHQKVLQDGLMEANIQLEKANAEMLQQARQKSDFIMLLRHEINTPLSVMKGLLSLWKMKGLISSEQEKRLPSFEKNLKRLEELSDRMKEIVHLEMELTDYMKTTFDAGGLMNDVVEELQPAIEEKGHTIVRDVQEELFIEADRIRLGEAIIVLLKNAMTYMDPPGTIRVSVRRMAHEIVLRVSDDGIGIPREEFDKIFERFYQVTEIKHHKEGFGLGLSIARKVVEQQGGRIWLESEVGKGSTFYIAMPAAAPDAALSRLDRVGNV